MAKELILYHGSMIILPQPVYGGGRPFNDFGPGFYCTEHEAMAMEWACTEGVDGFANQYRLQLEGLKVMSLNSTRYHILNWMAILLENRTFDLQPGLPAEARDYILKEFLPPYMDYDILVGYRADDSFFSFAKAFLSGTLSLEALGRAMRLGKRGEQIVLKSQNAFDRISFIGAKRADSGLYYPRRREQDKKARAEYMKLSADYRSLEAVYIIDILRQEWRNDDTRLR